MLQRPTDKRRVRSHALSINRTYSRLDRLLRGVTEVGDWEPWILYMLAAVEETAQMTRRRIGDPKRVHKSWCLEHVVLTCAFIGHVAAARSTPWGLELI